MEKVDLTKLQQEKLRKVFPFICSAPFYQKKLDEGAILGGDADPYSSLSKMPFTTKEELRSTPPSERSPLSISEIAAFFSSSGTTGQPSVYAWSKLDQIVYEKISSRLLRSIRVGPGDVTLIPMRMGMSFSWYGIFTEMQKVGAAVVPLGASTFEEIIQALVDYPITILKTSPVIASRLFRAIIEKDRSLLSKMKLRQIHLAGFFSSKAHRKRLEEQWGVDCYDMYGLSEFGLVSGECKAKKGQHYCADFTLLEVIRPEDYSLVSEGNVGVAVFTTLWRKASPLLRYWSNDFIFVNDEPCSCGLDLPRLMFRGRSIDSVLVSGRRIFASDIEEIIFGYGAAGDEYLAEVFGYQDRCRVKVQVETENYIPAARLEEQLNDLFRVPVELELLPLKALDRTRLKPQRMVDYREQSRQESD
jgi:phenylacetate-CoA ligase